MREAETSSSNPILREAGGDVEWALAEFSFEKEFSSRFEVH